MYAQPGFADEVRDRRAEADVDLPPPDAHMIGLAKDLIGQLNKQHFKDPDVESRVRELLKQSRLRGWKAGPPTPGDLDSPNAHRLTNHATLVAELGNAFGLFTENDDAHREAVEALLTATNQTEKTARLQAILKLSDLADSKTEKLDSARQTFDAFMRDTYSDQQTHAALTIGDDGDRLLFEWDPVRGDFVTRIQPADGSDEIVIHGGVAVTRDDAQSKLALQLDETPVTILDEQQRQRIRQALFGEWYKETDGSSWTINPADDAEAGASGPGTEDPIAADIKRMKAELASIQGKKVHIWINADTGENIVQTRYKRLKPPHIYMKDLSRNFYKDKIDQLQRDIEERASHYDPAPIDQYDPLDTVQQTGKPALLEVAEPDGYQYSYDDVSYDGERLTARRTLRDVRDISEESLPAGIREQLISSWSPPEWIELQPEFLVRTKEVILTGKRWRLHVTSRSSGGLLSTGNYRVSSIQDPYIDEEFTLAKAPGAVRLRFVDKDLQPFSDNLPFGEPILLEAEFEDGPKQPSRRVQLSWHHDAEPSEGGTFINVFRSIDRETTYRSEPFVLEASTGKAAGTAGQADK